MHEYLGSGRGIRRFSSYLGVPRGMPGYHSFIGMGGGKIATGEGGAEAPAMPKGYNNYSNDEAIQKDYQKRDEEFHKPRFEPPRRF